MTSEALPAFSIVMPVWNGERYLEEALESLFRQTLTDFELLVIDDGSTDRTLAILEQAAATDSRLRIIRMEHGGIVPALNRGVQEARSEWIARMDADDLVAPDWLESVRDAQISAPGSILFYSRFEAFGSRRPGKAPYVARSRGLLAIRLCVASPFLHPSTVFQKEAFLKAGGYRAEDRHVEDFALWARMLELGDFTAILKVNLFVRYHEASTTALGRSVQDASASRLCREHCQRFFDLKEDEVERTYKVVARRGTFRDWLWFLRHPLPRLRWPSREVYLWAAAGMLKALVGRR